MYLEYLIHGTNGGGDFRRLTELLNQFLCYAFAFYSFANLSDVIVVRVVASAQATLYLALAGAGMLRLHVPTGAQWVLVVLCFDYFFALRFLFRHF
jgi:hypothetical protein